MRPTILFDWDGFLAHGRSPDRLASALALRASRAKVEVRARLDAVDLGSHCTSAAGAAALSKALAKALDDEVPPEVVAEALDASVIWRHHGFSLMARAEEAGARTAVVGDLLPGAADRVAAELGPVVSEADRALSTDVEVAAGQEGWAEAVTARLGLGEGATLVAAAAGPLLEAGKAAGWTAVELSGAFVSDLRAIEKAVRAQRKASARSEDEAGGTPADEGGDPPADEGGAPAEDEPASEPEGSED